MLEAGKAHLAVVDGLCFRHIHNQKNTTEMAIILKAVEKLKDVDPALQEEVH